LIYNGFLYHHDFIDIFHMQGDSASLKGYHNAANGKIYFPYTIPALMVAC